jgi:carbonic anhydrase/acetyltransferase-like protein (isoleucine patch superfamily)
MPQYSFQGSRPIVGQHCYIALSADIIGKVTLGSDASVWFGTVIRGDVAPIGIGAQTNIQDLSMLHVTDDLPLTVGKCVTVGHRVTLHSCSIGDNCLIGMGATILDRVVVGPNCLVAAGSLLPPGKEYPANSFIIGSPAVVKRQLTAKELEEYGNHYRLYLQTKNDYLEDGDQRID